MATILVADDEAKMRKILSLTLSEEGHEILEAEDAGQAIELINNTSFSLIITDLRMPGGGGMAVLEAVKRMNHSIPIIILTAYGTIENAVEALKNGAHDYLLKPCDLDEIKLSVHKALQLQHLQLENLYLRTELDDRFGGGEIIGKSPTMLQVQEWIRLAARGDSPVLIRGESGTGKELSARTIHRQSPVADRPFITINCAGMPADLLELELFGRVRSLRVGPPSPTTGKFELANGGTLFLDEISEIPPRLQGKILRVIEEKVIEPVGGNRTKKVEVRIMASTKTDPEEKVQKGEMRSDFYFRLNVVPILIPPLRERIEDIQPLCDFFLRKKCRGRPSITFTANDIAAMMRYYWPGNVRELENVVERAIVIGSTDMNVLIPTYHSAAASELPAKSQPTELLELPYKDAKKFILDDFETYYFTSLLRKTHGNISRAAELAQIHRKNFHVKLAELGIDPHQLDTSELVANDKPTDSFLSP